MIVGGGPVGCALAAGLRRHSFEVDVYERKDDPRRAPPHGNHSFNITLSYRGLRNLEPTLRGRLYREGVRLSHRVVHQADGRPFWQPYGLAPEHHLLSMPRRALHACLVDAAEEAGARLHFRHACVAVDPCEASATFVSDDSVHDAAASVLVGCDGASSVVRRAMAQRVGLSVAEEGAQHGYVEMTMAPPAGQQRSLAAGAEDGFHVWPRGDHMLIAQPNVDGTSTSTLFLPFRSEEPGSPSFEQLDDDDDLRRFFRQQFPDAIDHVPQLTDEFWAAPPARLKTVRCQPFHHDRTMLVGDAAHTMLPFYGQGINCSLEDIDLILRVLERNLCQHDVWSAIQTTLTQVEIVRRPAWDAITALSREHLHELLNVADPRAQARAALELALHRATPSSFMPLYAGIAFTARPYDEVVQLHARQRRDLDDCRAELGMEAGTSEIVEAYRQKALVRDPAGVRAEPDLELSAAEKGKLLDLAASYLARHHTDVGAGRPPASFVADSVNVAHYEAGRRLSRALREDEVPVTGTDVHALLSEIFDDAVAAGTVHPHPGFMAHVPSGGLFQGAVGDFIARALNRFPGVWIAAPGLVQLEANVVRWFCSLLGYGPGSFGYLTTSGSLSNLMGLQCALHGLPEDSTRPPVVYTSEQGHYSVLKAARLIGVPTSQTRIVPCGPDYTLDLEELVRSIEADRAKGLKPACVVATAGTTNTGAIDGLTALARLSRDQELWLHVDACFGGFFRITARGRAAMAGIEDADSIAVDGHKSLFLPHGSSALLVKDRATLRATFERPAAAYLPGLADPLEFVDFCDYGPELSREVRGLTAWLPIKMHGIVAFERALDGTLDLASYLASELDVVQGIEVVRNHRQHLPVVAFYVPAADAGQQARLNQELCARICAAGRVYVTTTSLPDHGVVVRACILNQRTDRETVDTLATEVRSAMRHLAWE